MTVAPLYIDNHLLVVEKPAGTLSQSDITGDADLLSLCRMYIERRYNKPGRAYIGLVHRLDRPVSGVMIFARTSKAAERLSAQFRNGTVGKRYVAVVSGFLDGEGRRSDALVKRQARVRLVSPGTTGARQAVLNWRTAGSTGKETLVVVMPETGRPHQIRVQLAAMGHPITGDLKYGAETEFDGRNLALHCLSIEIEHPTLKKQMSFSTPIPQLWHRRFPEFTEIFDGLLRNPKS